MAKTFTLIASVIVGSGGASTINFSSIPAIYTDLTIVNSVRTSRSAIHESLLLSFNGATSNSTNKRVYGTGGGATSTTDTLMYGGQAAGATATSSTFGNSIVYIPNYAGSNNKSSIEYATSENNATGSQMNINGNLWSSSVAINQITLTPENGGTIQQYSTAYLYGIKNS
jgi:hypothetical protein